MIYYFSGTGNSRYAAEKLARLTGDTCVSIASIFNGTAKSVEGKKDVTGFVFPVYYSGLPEMVKRFAAHPQIRQTLGSYVFCVITCGAETAAADEMLERALGRNVDLSVSLRMPQRRICAISSGICRRCRGNCSRACGQRNCRACSEKGRNNSLFHSKSS